MSAENLAWLHDVESTPAAFKPTQRGRQPGVNPMAKHIEASYAAKGTPEAVRKLDVPAHAAWSAERLLRRAAGKRYSVSVQVQGADGTVIPLKEVKGLTGTQDVTLVFEASDPKPKSEKSEGETESDSADIPEDPFAGTPEATSDNGADVTQDTGNGKRGRKVAAAK